MSLLVEGEAADQGSLTPSKSGGKEDLIGNQISTLCEAECYAAKKDGSNR
jgi:hypothetical protein